MFTLEECALLMIRSTILIDTGRGHTASASASAIACGLACAATVLLAL